MVLLKSRIAPLPKPCGKVRVVLFGVWADLGLFRGRRMPW